MKEPIVLVETAKLAKKIRFDIYCSAFYGCDKPASGKPGNAFIERTWFTPADEDRVETQEGTMTYEAPKQSVLTNWIRERHKLLVTVDVDPDQFAGKLNYFAKVTDLSVDREGLVLIRVTEFVQDYAEALERGLYLTLKYINDTRKK